MAVISQSDHLIRVDFLYSMLAAKCQKNMLFFVVIEILACFTKLNDLQLFPLYYVVWDFIHFAWVVFHIVYVPHFLYLHTQWWTYGMIPHLSYSKLNWNKYGDSKMISYADFIFGGTFLGMWWLGPVICLVSDLWGIFILSSIMVVPSHKCCASPPTSLPALIIA